MPTSSCPAHSKGFLFLLDQRFCVHRLSELSLDSTYCFLLLDSTCRSLAVAAGFLEIVFLYLVCIFASSKACILELCWVVQRGDQPVQTCPPPCKGFGYEETSCLCQHFTDLKSELPDLIHWILNFILQTLKLGHTPLCAFVALPFFELDPVSALHFILLPRPSFRPQGVSQLCLHLSFRARIFIAGFPGLAGPYPGPHFLCSTLTCSFSPLLVSA